MNILLIEDHSLVAKSTADLIERICPQAQVTICPDGDSARVAIAEASKRKWHRILLDLDLPDVRGLALASVIEDCGLAGITVVITGTSSPTYPVLLEEMGFLGFLPKQLSFATFTDSLGQLLLRDDPLFLNNEVPRKYLQRITKRQGQALEGLGRGESLREIASEMGTSEGTVNDLIDDATTALGADDRANTLRRAIELGLLPGGAVRR